MSTALYGAPVARQIKKGARTGLISVSGLLSLCRLQDGGEIYLASQGIPLRAGGGPAVGFLHQSELVHF